MIRGLLAGLVLVAIVSLVPSIGVSALGLKVAPLEYKATLKEGEKSRGFIDVSNPSSQSMTVQTSVQGFRQIDDDGGLQFYDDERISAGIKPEINVIELGPREAARVYFTIDGAVLPEGDVFAAVFFTTEPRQPQNGVGQLVRVGTILSLINRNPGSRAANITGLDIPFIQLTDTITGSYRIKNTGPKESGFYPTVEISSWPGGDMRRVESSLVFGGRERSNDFSYASGYGIHRIEVSYGSSTKSQWVVQVAPWMTVLTLLVVLIVAVEVLLLKRRRKASLKKSLKKSS